MMANNERIRLETEAISIIMERFEDGRWRQLASDMAVIEINANPNAQRRRRARRFAGAFRNRPLE